MAALSLAVCFTLAILHSNQETTLQRSRRILRSFREARIDLSKGFLSLSLAGDPRSPFRREVGLALLDQAVAALNEAENQLTSAPAIPTRDGASERDFSAKINAFRTQLQAYGQAEPAARNDLVLPLHLAFHELERLAQQVDSASQHDLNELAARLRARFQAFLMTSILLLGLMCVGVDQVGRRQQSAEADLRESAVQLRTLGDNLPGGALYQLWMPPTGANRFTYASAGFERIFGMPTTRILPDPEAFWNLMLVEDRQRWHAEEARCAKATAVFDLEFRQRTVGGEVKWIHARSTPRRLPDGSILWDGVMADITERKRAEESVRQSEERLNFALQASHTGAWSLNLDDQTATRTLIQARIFGYSTTEGAWSLKRFQEHVLPEDREHVRRRIEEGIAAKTGWSFECRIRRVDGQVRWIFIAGGFEQDSPAQRVSGIVQDITERKQAEQALRKDAEELTAIVDAQREIAGANLDYPGLVQLILERLSRLTGAEGASLEVAEGDEMVYEAATGLAAPYVGLRLKIASSVSGTCLRSGELLGVDDSEADPRANRGACRRIGLRSMFLLPLRYDENSIGVLKLMSSRVAAFSNGIAPTLRLMGEFLSATVARKKAEESLRQQRNALQRHNEQLERFNRATVGRELRMIELKREINELCQAAGLPRRYEARAPTDSEPPQAHPAPTSSASDPAI